MYLKTVAYFIDRFKISSKQQKIYWLNVYGFSFDIKVVETIYLIKLTRHGLNKKYIVEQLFHQHEQYYAKAICTCNINTLKFLKCQFR